MKKLRSVIAPQLLHGLAGMIPCMSLANESGSVGCVARQPYVYYSTIVERQMFGALPLGFDPTLTPDKVAKTLVREDPDTQKAQESLAKRIGFSVVNVTTEGEVVVGFSDFGREPKTPVHYYLKVGESQDGWTVKSADSKTAMMTIDKDGTVVTLRLGSDVPVRNI